MPVFVKRLSGKLDLMLEIANLVIAAETGYIQEDQGLLLTCITRQEKAFSPISQTHARLRISYKDKQISINSVSSVSWLSPSGQRS